eukprot:COSAG04_NODE_2336_length_4308_cov_1.870516_6_plen_72_part_01
MLRQVVEVEKEASFEQKAQAERKRFDAGVSAETAAVVVGLLGVMYAPLQGELEELVETAVQELEAGSGGHRA